MLLLRIYIDDSADEAQEHAVVAGAYCGFYHQWKELWKKWKRRLKQDGLIYFRAAEYYSLRGQFERFRDPRRYPKPKGSEAAHAILADLETIIQETKVMGIAVCMDMKEYIQVRNTEPHASTIFPTDAFETALQTLVKVCAEIVRDEFADRPRQAAFVCDDSSSSARIAAVYSAFKQANPGLAEFMGALVHQDDKKFPQLQSADMMAHLAKGRFIDWLNDPNKAIFTTDGALKERLKRLNVHQIAIFNRDYMMAVLKHEVERRGLA